MNEPHKVPRLAEPVEARQKELEQYLQLIEENVNYWGRRHRDGLAVIRGYTIAASIIMSVNLAYKESIENVGGWVPFCLTAAVITGIAAYFTHGEKSEGPAENRLRCLQAREECKDLRRKLERSVDLKESQPALARFDKQLTKFGKEYAQCITKPPKYGSEAIVHWGVLIAAIGFYLVYIYTRATGRG